MLNGVCRMFNVECYMLSVECRLSAEGSGPPGERKLFL